MWANLCIFVGDAWVEFREERKGYVNFEYQIDLRAWTEHFLLLVQIFEKYFVCNSTLEGPIDVFSDIFGFV